MTNELLTMDIIYENLGVSLYDFTFNKSFNGNVTDFALLKVNDRVIGVCETLFRFMNYSEQHNYSQ